MHNLLPEYILENYKNNRFEGELQAFTMFIDISGFTSMTDKLMQSGSDGAEILSNILKEIFKSTVSHVYESGGFISTFAGDAFTAIFPATKDNSQTNEVQNVLYCAEKILIRFKEKPVQKTKYGNFEFNVSIGLSAGEVKWAIVGKKDKSFYFRGEAIDGSAKSEKLADKNEIIIDSKFKEFTSTNNIETEPISEVSEYFRITNFKNINLFKGESKTGLRHLDFTKDIFSKKFFPEAVFKVKEPGEFRNVISIFVSFDGISNNEHLDNFFTILIDNINHYSGYIENFDFGDKGGVVACFFGAPVSFEDNINRAINFILSIKLKIYENPELKKILKYRIGMTYGKVYSGMVGAAERSQYSLLGSKVNLAARLMMKAGWEEIWTCNEIYQSLKESYNFEKLSEQSFKGFEEKITPYRLIEAQKSGIVELCGGDMVGRDLEMKRMMDFIKVIFNGEFAGVIYVNGEIGIGKTRLVNEFRKEIENEQNVNWFYCSNEEILRLSLNPFKYFLINLFKQSTENSIDDNKNSFNSVIDTLINKLKNDLPEDKVNKDEVLQVSSELERTRSILGAMVDLHWEESLYEQLDPQLRFENTLFAFYNLVIAECMLKPVIIEIEDAHWLDKDSLELLNVIARNIKNMPLGIILSSRYLDDGRKFSLDLDDDIPQCDIDLSYLSTEGIKNLAEQILNNKIDNNSVLFLQEKTNGNPFFVEQLVLDFKERDIWKKKDDLFTISFTSTWSKETEDYKTSLISEEAIPSTINSVLLSRFDRLTTEVKHVVQSASVLGREFEVQVLSKMLKSDKRIIEEIKSAEEEQIWTLINELKCIYKHALLRDVVYNMQMKARLRELHLLAADSLKELFGDDKSLSRLEQYSYHFGIGNNIVSENNEIVVTQDDIQNIEHKKNIEQYLDLQKNLADEYEKECRYDETIHKCKIVINISRLLGNRELEIDYLIKNGKILGHKGVWDKTTELFDEALKIAEALGDKERISNCNATFGEHECFKGNYKNATTYLEKALKIFKELNDQEGVGRIIFDIGTVYSFIGNNDRAMEYYEKSLKIFESINSKKGISLLTANMGSIYKFQGQYQKSLEYYEKSLQIFKELGNKLHITQILQNIGTVYSDKGDFEKASQYYTDSLNISKELGFKEGISQVTSNMGFIFRYIEQFQKALEFYDKAINIAREIGVKYDLANHLIDKAELLYILKRYKDAKDINNEGLQIAIELAFEDYVFKGKLLASMIDFATGNKKQTLIKLKGLQSLAKDSLEKAELKYMIYKLLKSEKEMFMSEDELEQFREESLKIFEEQYSKTPDFKYKKKIEELTIHDY